MYRKYVRKWWLLKRNRIICPEIAVNSQFSPGKSKSFVKLPKKSKFFGNLPWKVFFCEIPWKKSKFFGNFPRKLNFSLNCLKIKILWKFALKNRTFLWNYMKKIEIFQKFAPKNWFFLWNCLKNQNCFTRIHDLPDFKPDWRRCNS